MSTQDEAPRALYRFDPHDEGIWLGLGLVRLSIVCGSMLLGALMVYAGSILLALVLLLLVPPMVLARWEGLPLLAWLPLRALYRLQGPNEWALNPEHVGFVTPLTTTVAALDLDDEFEDVTEGADGFYDLDIVDDPDGPHKRLVDTPYDVEPEDDLGEQHTPDSDGDLLW